MSATQPISLITATPGGGKTALCVQMMQEAIKKGRPLFVQGIPELKLPYIPCPPVKEWTEMRVDPEDPDERELPYFTFPENSLIVLDEAQRIFRVRPTGAVVPAHVAAFETVRHTGVTFLLMTQNPTFLDTHIRKLVGQHIHLRDAGLLGRWYYEWPECSNVENFANAPIKKKWKLPKSSFALYKSSSLHIKRTYTIPPVLMLFIACVLIAAFLAYRVYYRTGELTTPNKVTAQGGKGEASAGSYASAPMAIAKPLPSPSSNDAAEILASFVPVVAGHPETAPAYSALRQVKAMPVVIGGACTPTKCTCYTAQGTDAGLDDMQCREWVRKPPFDPYRDVQATQAPMLPADGGKPVQRAADAPKAVSDV
jgi:zona occludens toxin